MRESFGRKSPRKPPRAARVAHAAKSPKTSNAPQHRSPKKPLSFNIIAGKYRGKSLEMALLPSTRPTKAIVREAVFNMLGGAVQNSVFIEVFAGFGSNGFEAFSRGAKKVIFIEKNPAAFGILQKNIARFGEAKFGGGVGFGGARDANLGGAGQGNLGDARRDFGGSGAAGRGESVGVSGDLGCGFGDGLNPSCSNLGDKNRGDFGFDGLYPSTANLSSGKVSGANLGGENHDGAGLGGVNPSPANPRPLNLLAANPAMAKSHATSHNTANLGAENGGGVGFSNANLSPKKPSVANPNTLNQSAPAPATAGFSAGFVGESPNLANFGEMKLALNSSDAGFGGANSGGLNLGDGAAKPSAANFWGANLGGDGANPSEANLCGANSGDSGRDRVNPNAQKPNNAGFSAGFTNSNHSAANLNAAEFATLAPNAPRFAPSRGKDSPNAPAQSLDFRPADSHGKGSPAKDLDATPSRPTDFLGFSPSHDADFWGADSLKNADKGAFRPASSQSLDSPTGAQFAVSNSTPSRSVDFYGEDSPQGDFAGANLRGAARGLERDFGGSSAAQGNLGEAGCDFGGEDARLKETRLSGVNLDDSGLSGARFKDSQPKDSHSNAPAAPHSPHPAPANPPRSLSRHTPQCPAFLRPKNPPSALPNSTPPRPSAAQSHASPQKSPPSSVLHAISSAILPAGAHFKAQPAAAQTPAPPRTNPPSQAQPTTAQPTTPAPASSPNFLAFNADCFLLLENLAARFGADIFYFDPPFDAGIYARCFEAIARLGLGGKVLVFECDSSVSMPQNLGALTLAKLRRFGRTSVAIYQ